LRGGGFFGKSGPCRIAVCRIFIIAPSTRPYGITAHLLHASFKNNPPPSTRRMWRTPRGAGGGFQHWQALVTSRGGLDKLGCLMLCPSPSKHSTYKPAFSGRMTGQQRTKIGQIRPACCLIPVPKLSLSIPRTDGKHDRYCLGDIRSLFTENVSEAWPVR
jgi:hypothetical protein